MSRRKDLSLVLPEAKLELWSQNFTGCRFPTSWNKASRRFGPFLPFTFDSRARVWPHFRDVEMSVISTNGLLALISQIGGAQELVLDCSFFIFRVVAEIGLVDDGVVTYPFHRNHCDFRGIHAICDVCKDRSLASQVPITSIRDG